MEYIRETWPVVADAAQRFGIWDRENAAAIAGTIAIETAHSFVPVMESYYLFGGPTDYDQGACDAYNQRHLRYYPWFGKGLVQTTWESEYQRLQDESGLPFHDDPMTALRLEPAAYAIASFWASKNIMPFASAHDWTETRRRVQGGDSGLSELITYAESLLAL